MRTAALFMAVTTLAQAACMVVPSSKIVARDLAERVPIFRELDPDTLIALAPFPGIERVLTAHDLVLTARRYGLDIPAGEAIPSVCVGRLMRALSVEQVSAALLAALDVPAVRLEVLEFSPQDFPPGRLEFDRAALQKSPRSNPQIPVVWRGKLIYDDHHSLTVWAKVRASVEREVILAAEIIPQGTRISAEQTTVTSVAQFPSIDLSSSAPAMVIGRVARRTFQTGQQILAEALEEAQDIVRGETVHVRVLYGSTSICFDAIAQSSGQKGQAVVLHNPSSGRNFRGLIEDRQQVVVRASGEGTS
jgi:flagella basal body P-ring formation protein FlgA